MKKNGNFKKYLPLILYLVAAAMFIGGGVLIGLFKTVEARASGAVLIIFAFVPLVACAVIGNKNKEEQQRAEKNKSKHISEIKTPQLSVPQVKKKVNLKPHEGKVNAIYQHGKINLNIWGEVREIDVTSQRIRYAHMSDESVGEPFNEKELAELNRIIESDLINSEEVKNIILKYVNFVTEQWDDDYFEGKITSILPPEVEINELVINNLQEDAPISVAFCGECECDVGHGISVNFVGGKFVGVGDYMSFEFADTDELYTGEEEE